ncbi:hypothetical protein [Wenyingzhuangia sp. 2_MG-2023]|uniref:hypothetical protein n=1 Tax=Wenyingzhuangia sp. 2_MG-2023 TaxID=3062639 RepID=UPI0026E246CE|nr:hypothetical protein [Wenyingzhuangia sp. 2_MG-2023]MDO6737068.1 hypothetical protein [Wenyingzhuangia sp. 2_MG-2023]
MKKRYKYTAIKQDVCSVYAVINDENQTITLGSCPGDVKIHKELSEAIGAKTRLLFKSKEIYEYKTVLQTVGLEYKDLKTIGKWYKAPEKEIVERLESICANATTCKVIESFMSSLSATEVARQFRASRTGVIKYLKSKGIDHAEHNKPRVYKNTKDEKEKLSKDRIERMIQAQKLKYKKL